MSPISETLGYQMYNRVIAGSGPGQAHADLAAQNCFVSSCDPLKGADTRFAGGHLQVVNVAGILAKQMQATCSSQCCVVYVGQCRRKITSITSSHRLSLVSGH